jgi:hypothetical protein
LDLLFLVLLLDITRTASGQLSRWLGGWLQCLASSGVTVQIAPLVSVTGTSGKVFGPSCCRNNRRSGGCDALQLLQSDKPTSLLLAGNLYMYS